MVKRGKPGNSSRAVANNLRRTGTQTRIPIGGGNSNYRSSNPTVKPIGRVAGFSAPRTPAGKPRTGVRVPVKPMGRVVNQSSAPGTIVTGNTNPTREVSNSGTYRTPQDIVTGSTNPTREPVKMNNRGNVESGKRQGRAEARRDGINRRDRMRRR